MSSAISAAQIAELSENGVVLLRSFFPPDLVNAALNDVARQVDEVARALHRAGKITNLHEDAPIATRLALIEKEFPCASTILHRNPDLSDPFKRLWSHPKAVEAVQQIIGSPEVLALPNWNLRCKTPDGVSKNHATVPFHQDQAYGEPDAATVLQLSCWVPLVPISLEMGPMEYVPGNFWQRKAVMRHTGCWRNTWYLEIPEEEIAGKKRVVYDSMQPGDAILFDNFIPHRSLPNKSGDRTRWSCDLRWQDARLPTGCGSPGVKLGSAEKLLPQSEIDWSVSPIDAYPGWERCGRGDTEIDRGLLTSLISGPWMDRWEMTNVNEHVEAHRTASVPPLPRNPRKTQ